MTGCVLQQESVQATVGDTEGFGFGVVLACVDDVAGSKATMAFALLAHSQRLKVNVVQTTCLERLFNCSGILQYNYVLASDQVIQAGILQQSCNGRNHSGGQPLWPLLCLQHQVH